MNDDLTQFLPYQEMFEEVVSSKYTSASDKMFYLCKKGYINMLKPLLQDSDDKNPQDDDKYTILHCAVEHGHFKIVEHLVPLLNEKNPCAGPRKYSNGDFYKEMTPLRLATLNKNLPIIKLIAPHVNGMECLDTIAYLCEMKCFDLLRPLLKDLKDKNTQSVASQVKGSETMNSRLALDVFDTMCAFIGKNYETGEEAVLINKGEVATLEWLKHLWVRWTYYGLGTGTILLIGGRHTLESGMNGPKDDKLNDWHLKLVKLLMFSKYLHNVNNKDL